MTAVAISGLGLTEMATSSSGTTTELTGDAIAAALSDAGLLKEDVDGLLLCSEQGPPSELASFPPGTVAPDAARPLVQLVLGFTDLTVFNVLNAGTASAGAMLQYASLAISGGLARVVVMAHAFRAAPEPNASLLPGLAGLAAAYGADTPVAGWAAAARRHMHLYGTTEEQLGAIAVAQREWAAANPAALSREPLTADDYQRSPVLAAPLRELDVGRRTEGAVAFVVTSSEHAAALARAPVHVLGLGQRAAGDGEQAGRDPLVETAAREAAETAFGRAGLRPDDIDLVELHDPCTLAVLTGLEDHGFCAKGEGGPFAADGNLGPGGAKPTNTGGGELSGWSAWDFAPLAEAVAQVRGDAGERQLPAHDVALVGGTGGPLGFYTTTILASNPT